MYILCLYYVCIMFILCLYYVYIMFILCLYYVNIMFILCLYYVLAYEEWGHAAGGAVGWGTVLQAGRSRVRFPMVSLDFFHWHNPSGRTMALESTQPLIEMSTRNVSWGERRPVRRADNLTTFMCWLSWNLGASTSWNPLGLSRPVMGWLYLYGGPGSVVCIATG